MVSKTFLLVKLPCGMTAELRRDVDMDRGWEYKVPVAESDELKVWADCYTYDSGYWPFGRPDKVRIDVSGMCKVCNQPLTEYTSWATSSATPTHTDSVECTAGCGRTVGVGVDHCANAFGKTLGFMSLAAATGGVLGAVSSAVAVGVVSGSAVAGSASASAIATAVSCAESGGNSMVAVGGASRKAGGRSTSPGPALKANRPEQASGPTAAAATATAVAQPMLSRKQEVHAIAFDVFGGRVAAAAVMGNIAVETGGTFDYQQRQHGGGPGRGLFQMERPMWSRYEQWRAGRPDSAEHQMRFIKRCLDTGDDVIGAGNARVVLRALAGNDVRTAAKEFQNRVERPGVKHEDRRLKAAEDFLKELPPRGQ